MGQEEVLKILENHKENFMTAVEIGNFTDVGISSLSKTLAALRHQKVVDCKTEKRIVNKRNQLKEINLYRWKEE